MQSKAERSESLPCARTGACDPWQGVPEGRGEAFANRVPSSRAARVSDPATPPTEGLPDPSVKSYQLTHDYLVPALWDWLTRKQREARRSRAELRLAERAVFCVWESAATLPDRPMPAAYPWDDYARRYREVPRGKPWTSLEEASPCTVPGGTGATGVPATTSAGLFESGSRVPGTRLREVPDGTPGL